MSAAAALPIEEGDFVLDLCAGEHCLDITVYNSYANLLEGYAECGGLLSGGTLTSMISDSTGATECLSVHPMDV